MVNVEKFIEDYIDLIDSDRWSDIYNIFNMDVSDDGETGDFTRMLLSAGIDPLIQGLPNMRSVPFAYMYVGDETNPENIKITEYEIPEGIQTVMDYAFWGNKQLTYISLPHSLKSIKQHALGNCPNLRTIKYNGTWKEWKAIDSIKLNYDLIGTKYITCVDGDFNMYTGAKKL